ncbi:MAG: acyl carrier protein [Chitinophagales bacterium]
MSNEEITERINTFISEEFEVDRSSITPEASLKDTLGLDSLDYVDLVVLIEGNFGFKVKQEDFQQLRTFNDFYNYVIDKVAVKQ